MRLLPTPLAGLLLVENDPVSDERGAFLRVFCRDAVRVAIPDFDVLQANLSTTRGAGSVRGLHYQRPPDAETKLVRCLRGRVFDVAVDVRAGSPTFLQWHGQILDARIPAALLIPVGFAHGFQVLSDEADLLYFHSARHAPTSEGGLRHDDPRLGIAWPLPTTRVSERDRSHPLVDHDFAGIAP